MENKIEVHLLYEALENDGEIWCIREVLNRFFDLNTYGIVSNYPDTLYGIIYIWKFYIAIPAYGTSS